MVAEQINIFELTKPKYKIKKPIRLIELFAGIGSQAKAFKNINANFEHYRVVDFDKYAIRSYNAIYNTDFPVLDITKINGNDLGIINTKKFEYIMTYSFPCQDLSIAGNQKGMKKGDNTRSGLLWEVERLLDECRELPQVLLMENHGTVTATQLSDLRVRKLTPKECWRLMGFSDEDFEKASKVNSDTQLYKQAGNSIVVNVLEAIFKELIY